MSPLTNDQKASIGALARTAYQAWPEREAFEAINSELTKTEIFTSWRRVEQGKACGIQSLRECTQDHYGRLKAYFQRLGGATAAATRTAARDTDNDRRIARWKLEQELKVRGLQVGYAAAICRNQFHLTLDQASARQLWCLIYTVRSRKKPAAAAPAKPIGEVPF